MDFQILTRALLFFLNIQARFSDITIVNLIKLFFLSIAWVYRQEYEQRKQYASFLIQNKVSSYLNARSRWKVAKLNKKSQ